MATANADMIVVDIKPVEVLTDAARQAAFIAEVRRVTSAHVPDLKSDRGRKAISSLAYKVSRTKTALAAAADEITEEWRAKVQVVTTAKKAMATELDAIRDEVRKPLTDWEEARAALEAHVKETTTYIESASVVTIDDTPEELEARCAALREMEITRKTHGEAAHITGVLRVTTIGSLTLAVERLRRERANREEFEALRLKAEQLEAENAALLAKRERQEAEDSERERLRLRGILSAVVDAADYEIFEEPDAPDQPDDEFAVVAEEFVVATPREQVANVAAKEAEACVPDPEPNTLWTHRNGNTYRVLMITNLPDEERYPKTVVYQNVDNGTLWSRRANDWWRSFERDLRSRGT